MRAFVLATMLMLASVPVAAETCGLASWYGIQHVGKKMANGKRFDNKNMTAAHKTLPLGTRLRVSKGKKHVVLTVTDRGPYAKGRTLDVAEAVAKVLGFKKAGVGRVCFERI